MSTLNSELVFLVLQFLKDEKFNEAATKLEKESGLFFNMKYFEEKVKAGEWDEAENYLSAFTKVDDNRYSMKTFFEIRKHKYLEALDRQDKVKALEILVNDLNVFSAFNKDLYNEMTQLLTLENFRENVNLSNYRDHETGRSSMLIELKRMFELNPLFREKLVFPRVEASRLKKLINQSLNWQHLLCQNPRGMPEIETLYVDHSCTPYGAASPAPVNPSLGANEPFPPTAAVAAGANALAGAMVNAAASSSAQADVVAASSLHDPPISNQVPTLKRTITPPATLDTVEHRNNDHEQSAKRLRPAQSVEEVPGPSVANVVAPKVERSSPERFLEENNDRMKSWKLTEIMDPSQCCTVTIPDSIGAATKVARLLYSNSGDGLLALGSNGIQKLWKWVPNEQNRTGKATASVAPQHWQPSEGLLMTNDVSDVNPEEAVPCIALSKNDCYVVSAAGRKITLFSMKTFNTMKIITPPASASASTFLAFHPQDNNIIFIGMEDSTINIYDNWLGKVKSELKGHQKRITGLAFSTKLKILVSSGADAQLCTWSINTWNKRTSVPLQLPSGKAPGGDTRIQFHTDQIRLLVADETQLSLYDASKMERLHQWLPQDSLSAPISCASYSCNSQLIFATFCDGNIGIFDADALRLRCRVAPSAYLPHANQSVYPVVVAAHPQEVNQFAVGLTDGSVKVMEPAQSDGKLGTLPPADTPQY